MSALNIYYMNISERTELTSPIGHNRQICKIRNFNSTIIQERLVKYYDKNLRQTHVKVSIDLQSRHFELNFALRLQNFFIVSACYK